MLFCVAMVRRLASNCIREEPQSANCSCVSRLASQFSMAIMDAVSLQAFIAFPSLHNVQLFTPLGMQGKIYTEFTRNGCFDNM